MTGQHAAPARRRQDDDGDRVARWLRSLTGIPPWRRAWIRVTTWRLVLAPAQPEPACPVCGCRIDAVCMHACCVLAPLPATLAPLPYSSVAVSPPRAITNVAMGNWRPEYLPAVEPEEPDPLGPAERAACRDFITSVMEAGQ